MKFLTQILLGLTILSFLSSLPVQARSGCCSHHGGVCGGTCCDGSALSAVCGGGGYQPVQQQYYAPPQQVIPTTPPVTMPTDLTGTVDSTYSSKTRRYSVTADWSDVSWSTGYSIAISKVRGGNPGPLVDTVNSNWTFSNVAPGTWYVNLKAKKGNRWADNVTYWTVTVPAYPGSAPAVKKAAVKRVVAQPTAAPTNVPAAGFTCNCAKTCPQMSSCAEAQYQLNVCGCSRRDADHDGVACDSECG